MRKGNERHPRKTRLPEVSGDYAMKRYKYPYSNMPGPGDEETWGPCTGHPLDPRTPEPIENTDEFADMKESMQEERIKDINGWFIESFSEAPDATLKELSDCVLAGDNLRVGDIVSDLVHRYCTPDDEDVREAMGND